MPAIDQLLLALLVIFALPYAAWRLLNCDDVAPLVVVQIICGILLGPGILGHLAPNLYQALFGGPITNALSTIAAWAIMLFVFSAGLELDLGAAWTRRGETILASGLALGIPLLLGATAALGLLSVGGTGWIGSNAANWQFVLGIGMTTAVTALPILVLFLEKLGILREPLGQKVLRIASLDDVAIWAVLAIILVDWQRIGLQAIFLVAFILGAFLIRKLVASLGENDRWPAGLVWLIICAFGADWCGLHYMVGAFLSGAVLDGRDFGLDRNSDFRRFLLLSLMPIFFLSTGLKTRWDVGGLAVIVAALVLLIAAVAGKIIGVRLAGQVLGWDKKEAIRMGWLLQTKALIMIIFANVLFDRQLITSATFTATLLMAVASTMLTVPMVKRA